MSNHLAIATVTAVLKDCLQNALADDFDPDPTVTHIRPDNQDDDAADQPSGVNIYLYQVSPNGALSNVDLPSRSADGRVVQLPSVALDLHYLLTFYGDETLLEPQRFMGSVVRKLESNPVLTRGMIEKAFAGSVIPNDLKLLLADSDLALAVESVRFAPEALTLEELSKLWSVLFEVKYNLSLAYRASVVLIEAKETARPVLPVAERGIFVMPSIAAAAVSPDDIPGLQLWLKSDAGLTYDSDGVSGWLDQSGNGNNAIQATINRRPSLIAHGLGNKPVLRFDGTDDDLEIQNLSYTTSGEIGEITVCALVRSTSKDAQIIASFDRDEYWRFALSEGADQQVAWDTTDSTGTIDDLQPADSILDGQWHLVIVWFAAGETPDKQVFVDGSQVAEVTAHGGNSLGQGNIRSGFIGVGTQAGTRRANTELNGDLAEFLIYHHALTESERGQLEKYFVRRYGQ